MITRRQAASVPCVRATKSQELGESELIVIVFRVCLDEPIIRALTTMVHRDDRYRSRWKLDQDTKRLAHGRSIESRS